jgi:signal transduction histidine kinase
MNPQDSLTAKVLATFSDFPLCAPDPLAEFCDRARRALSAPIAAIWRGDFSPGQLLLERAWNLSAAEAFTLWAEIESSLTVDSPSILNLDESPWRFRSPGAKRISSLIYLPIMSSQRFLGAVIIARAPGDAKRFTRAELQGLRLPLQAVAFALENERLAATAEVMTQRLELLANSMPLPVCFLDANRNVTRPNEAFKAMLGLPDDFTGGDMMAIWEGVKPEVLNSPEVEERLQEALSRPTTGKTLEIEFDGDEELHYRLMTVPFLDKQGRYAGGAMIGLDLTPEHRLMRLQQENIDLLDAKVQGRTRELHRANEELRLANEELRRTDQIKTDFMSNMSHELRTPLNQIMGYGSMLKDGVAGALSEEQRSFADNILEGANRVLRLVNAILDLTRIDAGKFTLHPTWNDYPEFLANVVETFRPQLIAKRLEVAFELAPDVATVWFSPEEIQQVLTNLVGNAIKFTPDGGRITLRTFRENGGAVTEVEDTGVGIPPEDHARIFGRFVQADSSLTRRYGGSGLGLAIVKQLVELHGGQVSLRSDLNQGACFSFWLGQPDGMSPQDAGLGAFSPARDGEV